MRTLEMTLTQEGQVDSSRKNGVERGMLRPPSEARSLLVRLVRNCPWNRCSFCPAYKGETFSIRPLTEVKADIDQLADEPGSETFSTAFLQDADALLTPTDDLEAIIRHLRFRFPRLARITAYARSNTLVQRSVDELRRLREAGLSRIHVGLESGSEEVLKFVQKGTTAATQQNGCLRVRDAGIEVCCYVMPGLGGRRLSAIHARETGRLIAAVSPEHVRLRTCVVLEGTPLAQAFREGFFEPQTEQEIVSEIRTLVIGISNTKTELVSDHRINLLLELTGRLPDEKDRLLGIIDRFLTMAPQDQRLFIVGRRKQLIRRLDDFFNADRAMLQREAETFTWPIPLPQSILY